MARSQRTMLVTGPQCFLLNQLTVMGTIRSFMKFTLIGTCVSPAKIPPLRNRFLPPILGNTINQIFALDYPLLRIIKSKHICKPIQSD